MIFCYGRNSHYEGIKEKRGNQIIVRVRFFFVIGGAVSLKERRWEIYSHFPLKCSGFVFSTLVTSHSSLIQINSVI